MLTSPHIEFLRTIALDSALQTVKWIAAKFPFVRATSELRHVEWLEKRKVQSYSHIIDIAHDRIIEVLKYRYPIFAWKKISNFRLISFEFEGKVVTYFFFGTETSQNLSRKPNSEQAIFQKASVRNVGRSRSMHWSESLIDGGAWPDCADMCKQLCSNIV